MDVAHHFGHGVVSAAPDEHVTVAVARDHVTGVAKGEACHVFRLVTLVENTSFTRKGQRVGVHLPKVDKSLADNNYGAAVERVKFGGDDCFCRALGFRDFVAAIAALPIPD